MAALFSSNNLNGSCYLTGTKTTGANVNGLVSTVNNSLNLSDVGLPCSVCLTVRVRNIKTENNALAANIAFCHYRHLLLNFYIEVLFQNQRVSLYHNFSRNAIEFSKKNKYFAFFSIFIK